MYQFRFTQFIPASVDSVWSFIATPNNLAKITPNHLGFKILNPEPVNEMYPGLIIAYRVKPVLGIPVTWVTEITHVKDGEYFVDEQRVGPYAMWHHEHHLTPKDGGVLMTDIVSYLPPFGPFGRLANGLFIRSQIQRIFDYRKTAIDEFFKNTTPD